VKPDHQPVVLIAEDSPGDLLLLRRAFTQIGHSYPVQYVHDGEEAIAYLAGEGKFEKRREFPLPDFFLLDLKMPRKNGFEVLQWLQTQPTLSRLRTVVLTTSDDIRDISKAYQLGAASFLTKPLNFTEFKDTLQSLFNYWVELNKRAPVSRPAGSLRFSIW
jgi:CheY-like chemotaxis protein